MAEAVLATATGLDVGAPEPGGRSDVEEFSPSSGEQGGEHDGADPYGEQEPQEGDEAVPQGPLFDGKSFDKAFKDELDKLKVANPGLANRIKHELIRAHQLTKEIPTVREARELKQSVAKIEDMGGFEKIEGDLRDFDSLSTMFRQSSPDFVQDMVDTDPDAFLKMAPVVFDKYRELDGDGYSAYISRIMVTDALQNKIPMMLERLADFLPADNPRAQAVLKHIGDYFVKREEMAQTPTFNAKKKQEPDAGTKQFDQERLQLKRDQWGLASQTFRSQLFTTTFNELSAGRKVNAEDRAEITERYRSYMQKYIKQTSDFNSRMERFFNADDRKGYDKHVRSFDQKYIPLALKTAMDKILGNKASRPAVAAPVKKAAVPGTPQPAQGFKMLNARPENINFRDTPRDWIAQRKAILWDGTKVQWPEQRR